MKKLFLLFFILSHITFFPLSTFALAIPTTPLDINLRDYAYPFPVKFYSLTIENQSLQMAYMDVAPTGPVQNKTIVLLHGAISFGAYWQETIRFLSCQGYRVIVPDQLGFGKSSKANIHYSFQLLARNTNQLLSSLGIHQVILIGHSFGGALAARFALMYPQVVTQLVLEDPLGLEDYRFNIPFKTLDEMNQFYLHPTWESLLSLYQSLYVTWNDRFLPYVDVAYQVSLNRNFPRVAFTQAMMYEMIYTQPMLDELSQLTMPVLFIYGDQDRIAPGKNFATLDNQKILGQFSLLVPKAAASMVNARVVALSQIGHVPHLEATQAFHQAVIDFLNNPNSAAAN